MQHTKAYKLLEERESVFLNQVNEAIDIANKMLPLINSVFTTYTIHGIKHSINVAEYMFDLIEDAKEMSDLELVMLIYAALFHDSGMIVSDQEIMGVDPVSFTSLYTFDNLFYEVPAQRNITCFTVSSGRREFMVNDNKGYGLNASSMGSNRNTLKFGVPCKDESGELAPWCAQMATAGYMGVVYNQSTQKFRCLKNNGSALSDFSVQGKEAAFDCNQVGLELVASDFGRNNYEHILMKDASGHHYLLVADFCGIFTQNAIGKAKYDLGGCEGLDKKVVSVTAGYKGEIFYYASGNTLYLLDYKSVPAKATPVWTAPAGTEITCVRLQKYLYGASGNKPVNDCEVIYIATADIAGEGVVYQLRVDPSSGVVDKSSEKSYDGFGRVMDMGWKKQ